MLTSSFWPEGGQDRRLNVYTCKSQAPLSSHKFEAIWSNQAQGK